MTLNALKFHIRFSRIDFNIQNTTIIRGGCNVASGAIAATRKYLDLFRLNVGRIHLANVMARGAAKFRMAKPLVSECRR